MQLQNAQYMLESIAQIDPITCKIPSIAIAFTGTHPVTTFMETHYWWQTRFVAQRERAQANSIKPKKKNMVT